MSNEKLVKRCLCKKAAFREDLLNGGYVVNSNLVTLGQYVLTSGVLVADLNCK